MPCCMNNPRQNNGAASVKSDVIFLFNHDAGHQVAHLAGIAGAFALREKAFRAIVAFGSEVTREQACARSPDIAFILA